VLLPPPPPLQGKKAPTIISILPVPQHVPEGGNTGPSRSISLSTDVYQGPLKYPYMWVQPARTPEPYGCLTCMWAATPQAAGSAMHMHNCLRLLHQAGRGNCRLDALTHVLIT
jgi:hypothetical protein